METVTVLVKEPKEYNKDEKFTYFKVELPEYFYEMYKTKEQLNPIRYKIESLFRDITTEKYVMAKFDKLEKYFDQ